MIKNKRGIQKFSLLDILFWGAIIHTLAYNVIHPYSKMLGHIMALVGILMCVYFYCINFIIFVQKHNRLQPLQVILIIYSLIVIIRGFITNDLDNHQKITTILANNRGVLGYLTPLILFYTPQKKDIKTFYRISYICSWFAIGYVLLHFSEIFLMSHSMDAAREDEAINGNSMGQIAGYFAMPASLNLFLAQFVPKRYVRAGFVAFVLSLLSSVAFARRSFIAFHLIILVLIIYSFLQSTEVKSWNKRLLIIVMIIFVACIPILLSHFSIFNLLNERFSTDTRSGVEMEFYKSLQDKPLEWLFGKGMFGTYYSTIFKDMRGNADRLYIETGYLQFILNGGLIMLILYVSILLNAAYKGYFKSNNTLCKVFSLFIVANILFLISGNSIEASIKGVMIWIMVYMCNTQYWRVQLSNTQLKILKQYLKKRK
jgi:hypothetical protein